MIREFQGKYRWLSNFAPCLITLAGVTYNSVEHAYMSAKSDDPAWKNYCAKISSPGEVKRASRGIKLTDNWKVKKLQVMRKCLDQKYNQEPYKSKLIATGTEHIQEGNHWNDRFWGGCASKQGKGQILLEK